MKKTVLQLVALVAIFFGVWLGLSQINFVKTFKVKEKASKMEEALGDFYMEMITDTNGEITDTTIVNVVNRIKERIAKNNGIDAEHIKVHVIRNTEVNAFALPDGHLVINSELITYSQNAEELAGVMAHEIAHIEKNHIMRKLSKEIGFAALSAMLNTGSGGAEGLRILTSTAYDRQMEDEADKTGVKYLINSKINPAPLADFMYRLSTGEPAIQKRLTIVSTHPETEKRAKEILDLAHKETVDYEPLVSETEWDELQKKTKML